MTTRRARDAGLIVGTGPHNAIRVGHTTLIRGHGPLRAGEGPVHTGVTEHTLIDVLARDGRGPGA
jgi:hypothetical protein